MRDTLIFILGLFCIIFPLYAYFSGHPYESMKWVSYRIIFWEHMFGKKFTKGFVLFISMPLLIILGCVIVGIQVMSWYI